MLLQEVLELNTFNHPWKCQVSYAFPPAIVPSILPILLAKHVTGLVAPCWMEAPWLPTVHSYVGEHLLLLCHGENPVRNISVNQVLRALPLIHSTLWLHKDVCEPTGAFFLDLLNGEGVNSSIYIKSMQTVLERIGMLVCSRWLKQCLFLP